MSRGVPDVSVVEAEVGVDGRPTHLCHDLPCRHCGHAPHRFLPCDHGCDCPGDLG